MITCDICRFSNPEGFAYCGRCGNWLLSNEAPTDELDVGTIEGERKQVTIIFADISGFTALNDVAKSQADIEQVLQVVNHCMHMLSEAVYEFDGYIDKFMGDAIMAIFGAPRIHEDDPERALRAALLMRERLDAFNANPPFPLAEPLGIHIGINTGTVIAGLVGTKRKRSYTVMGDAVNVASRLESVSERGEFLISQDTYNLTHRLFVFKERESVTVKGKREPLKIYELIGARSQRASQRGIAGLRAPLVGREAEFDKLQQQVTGLTTDAGKSGINVIIGDAGLGKSRLTSELYQMIRRDMPHVLWFEGRSLSFQQHVSYKLFIDIFRLYLGVSGDESAEIIWQQWQEKGESLLGERSQAVIPYLATLMGIKLPEEITQHMPLADPMLLHQRLFAAVGEWVETLAAQQPLVLVFEDLHWADTNSIDLLEYLASISLQLPLVLICITRPERLSEFWQVKERAEADYPERYTELRLSPLTDDQSRYLVDQLLRVEQLPDVLERLILTRSEGNPLFMEEVLRSLIEDGTLMKNGTGWQMTKPVTEINIPETLAGVLTARIDRLDEPVKRILQIAAVIGRIFHRDILAMLDEVVNLDNHLDALIVAELIRQRHGEDQNEFIFKHVLVQEAAYDSLLLQHRQAYHKRIADHLAQLYWMKGEEYASTAAHHYEQGEAWPRALTYLTRAAKAARNAFDNNTAINFYTRALKIADKVPNTETQALLEIYEGRGDLLKRLGQIDNAKADFERILALAETEGDNLLQMRALNELGKLHDDYQDYRNTAHYFMRSLAIARQIKDEPGIVNTLNELAVYHINMGELDQAESWLTEAMEFAQNLESQQYITDCQNGLAEVALYRGDVANSIVKLEAAIPTWRDLGNHEGLMRAYVPLATAYSWQGDYARSDKICSDALEILERFGDLNWVPQVRFVLAQNALARFDFAEIASHITVIIETASKLGKGLWHAIGLACQAHYHLLIGQLLIATDEIERAFEMAETIQAPLWTNRVKLILGLTHAYMGNIAEADQILTEVYQNFQSMNLKADAMITLAYRTKIRVADEDAIHLNHDIATITTVANYLQAKPYQAYACWLEAQQLQAQDQIGPAIKKLEHGLALITTGANKFMQFEFKIALAQMHFAQEERAESENYLHQAEQLLNQIAKTIIDSDEQEHYFTMQQAIYLQPLQKALGLAKVE